MTSYRYIGYGVTNSNGVAHLDHDPQGNPINGYTGTGAGEVDVIASTDNPISSGSIVSETYSIWDYLFYDDGITSPKTANWTNYSDRLTVSVDETGTTLLRDASSGTGYYFTPLGYSTPFAMEFEISAISDRMSCGIDFSIGTTVDNNKNFNSLWIQVGDTVKITYDGETIKVYRNGSTTPYELSLTISNDVTLGFYIPPTHSIKFKNFRMYKI